MRDVTTAESEFIYHATIINGGYTYRPDVSTPRTGYMVGGIVQEVIVPLEQFSSKDVHDFAMANQDDLKLHTASFIGTWVDRSTGMVHLDLSEHFSGLDAAMAIAQSAGEKAIYGIEHGEDIPVPKT
jgi:hypothetical protein